jgi:hypothetical protein
MSCTRSDLADRLCGTVRRPWTPQIVGDVAIVPLTSGKFAQVDIVDLKFVAPYAWAFTAGLHTGYAVTQVRRRVILMHRLLTGAGEGVIIDHVDMDGLNNCQMNLRRCTKQENNRRRRSNRGKSPFKGVAFHRHSGLHHATINVDGRQISLRYHKTAEDAARAYDAAAIEHFGAYALTNKELGLL